eukprot:3776167-Rhodomonas_salina.3
MFAIRGVSHNMLQSQHQQNISALPRVYPCSRSHFFESRHGHSHSACGVSPPEESLDSHCWRCDHDHRMEMCLLE